MKKLKRAVTVNNSIILALVVVKNKCFGSKVLIKNIFELIRTALHAVYQGWLTH